jgi:hypothetical protein
MVDRIVDLDWAVELRNRLTFSDCFHVCMAQGHFYPGSYN